MTRDAWVVLAVLAALAMLGGAMVLGPEWWRTSTGLDNTPTDAALANLRRVALAVRDVFGPRVVVTSGYRAQAVSDAINAALGRTERVGRFSYHLRGQAADLVPSAVGGLSMDALEYMARASGRFDYVLNEGSHVHVEVRG